MTVAGRQQQHHHHPDQHHLQSASANNAVALVALFLCPPLLSFSFYIYYLDSGSSQIPYTSTTIRSDYKAAAMADYRNFNFNFETCSPTNQQQDVVALAQLTSRHFMNSRRSPATIREFLGHLSSIALMVTTWVLSSTATPCGAEHISEPTIPGASGARAIRGVLGSAVGRLHFDSGSARSVVGRDRRDGRSSLHPGRGGRRFVGEGIKHASARCGTCRRSTGCGSRARSTTWSVREQARQSEHDTEEL